MKAFSAKSSAVRAAANHFKVARNMAEVAKVAVIKQDKDRQWFWEAVGTKKVASVKEVKPTKVKKPTTKATKKVEVPQTKVNPSIKGKLIPLDQLQDMSMGKLSIYYNALIAQFGGTVVLRFAHKREAVKRTMALQTKHL